MTRVDGGCWIPPWVFGHEGLSLSAKALYGRIEALSTREGYCWATDEHFAEEFGVSTRTIRTWLVELEDVGFIGRETSGPKRAIIPRKGGSILPARDEKAEADFRLRRKQASNPPDPHKGEYKNRVKREATDTSEQRELLPVATESDPPDVTDDPQTNGSGEKKRKRPVPLPSSWAPNAGHQERAANARLDIERETDKFRAHAEETGRTAKSWDAAFTRWLLNAEEYADRDGRSAPVRRQTETPKKIGGYYWLESEIGAVSR